MDILKSVLVREMVDEIVRQNMGIQRYCIKDLVADIDQVVDQYREDLSTAEGLLLARDGIKELIQRMAISARGRAAENMSETDRHAAKSQCGITFFCRPPQPGELGVK